VKRALAPAAILLLLAVAGCATTPRATPADEPRARNGNPPFYEVNGRRYVVLETSAGYVEQGIASWYGPDFHGKRTATGETYDMHAMTGAHPTLPLPAWVRVTNLQNGRSVEVRLNDRGPFSKNRIIDLSRAAAERLDMIRTGTAIVEVRSLWSGTAAPAPPSADRFYAQAGAFAEEDNALGLAARLRAAGVAGVSVSEARVDGRQLFRVRAGPVASVAEFDLLIEQLRAAGAESPRLVVN
jgi:rare lipoprotein A